jgi:hypothetical protein
MAPIIITNHVSGLKTGANRSPWANRPRRLFLAGTPLALICCVAVYCWLFGKGSPGPISRERKAPIIARSPTTLRELLSATPLQLGGCDIALMDLLCAEGLPGAERLDVQNCLATLDRWTDRVRSETQRHLYRYRSSPGQF